MKYSFKKYNFIFFFKQFKIIFIIILIQLYIFINLYSQGFILIIKKKIQNTIFIKNLTFQEPILPSNLSLFSNNSLAKKFDKCLLEEFNFSKIHYKESLYDNIDLIKNLKIIVMMFAGRKKYLEYNIKYLRKLLKEKIINEVHFWLYTKNINDTKYIKDNSNLYKTIKNHKYNEIFTEIKENSFNISVKTNNSIFIKLNNIYEIILNNNNYNYIYIYKNYQVKYNNFKNRN